MLDKMSVGETVLWLLDCHTSSLQGLLSMTCITSQSRGFMKVQAGQGVFPKAAATEVVAEENPVHRRSSSFTQGWLVCGTHAVGRGGMNPTCMSAAQGQGMLNL